MKTGILGGTFDPVHTGHLTLAHSVREQLGLDNVLFVPAGRPWLKVGSAVTDPAHRLAMVRLAVAGMPDFRVSTMEIERPGPSYTVDTLTELRGEMKPEDELYFILGWDNLMELPKWRRPAEIIRLACLAAVPRVGYPVPDLKKLETSIPGVSDRAVLLDKPLVNISATVIRDRVRRRLSIRHLVPEPVDRYIQTHGLYREVREPVTGED